MSMTDPIADMLTRIRNAWRAGYKRVDMPASKLKREIARTLKDNKFIENYIYAEDKKQGVLRIYLRYNSEGESIIRGIERISKPGLRKYVTRREIPRVLDGLGIAILSTSKGLMTDREARLAKVGGEVLCFVW